MTELAEGAVTAPPPPAAARESWDAGAKFYLTMAAIAALIIIAGFTPSFYLKNVLHAPPPLSPLTIVHGVVFTAWVALFLVQAGLIAARRPAPHRQLGILGAVLFGVMVSLGVSTSITAARLGHVPPGAPAPLAFMALPLFAMGAAAVLVVGALWQRRRSDWHKRLMLASLFAVTGPGTHRLAVGAGLIEPAITLVFAVSWLLLGAAVVRDVMVNKRIHPAYHAAILVFLLMQGGVYWGFASPAWMDFARAITA